MIMSCRLQNLLMDYKERLNGIPVLLKAVMKPFIGQVEDALTPGLMQLSWTSLNIKKCTCNSRRSGQLLMLLGGTTQIFPWEF